MDKHSTTKVAAQQPISETWNGAFEAFGEILERMKRNPLPAVVTIISYMVLSVVDLVFKVTDKLPYGKNYELSDFLVLIFIVGLPLYCLYLADNKRLSIGAFLRANLNPVKFLNMLVAGLLVGFILVASLAILIVPAIWTVAWFYLYAYPIVDKHKNASMIEALNESKRLAQDHKAKVWGIVGATMLMALVTVLLTVVPVVGLVLSAAFSGFMSIITGGAAALLYRWLQQHVAAEPTAE